MMPIPKQSTRAPLWPSIGRHGVEQASETRGEPLAGLFVADVVIVGAGLPGLVAAQTTLAAGLKTIVIDAGEIGGEATSASAGVLGKAGPDVAATPHLDADPIGRLTAVAEAHLAQRGLHMLSPAAVEPNAVISLDLGRWTAAALEQIAAAGGILAPRTRALGFGQIGSETWVISTEQARISAKALIVAAGAMTAAPSSFAPAVRKAIEPSNRWTFATAPATQSPLARWLAQQPRIDVVDGVERTAHVDAHGRLIFGGIVGTTELEARGLLRRWLSSGSKLDQLPDFVSVAQAPVAGTAHGAAQIHRLGLSGLAIVAPERNGLAVGAALGEAVGKAVGVELTTGCISSLPLALYSQAQPRRAIGFARRLGVFGLSA